MCVCVCGCVRVFLCVYVCVSFKSCVLLSFAPSSTICMLCSPVIVGMGADVCTLQRLLSRGLVMF